MLAELEEARQVQRALIPRLPFSWGPWRFMGALLPSSAVGGDLLDVVPCGHDRCVALLIDVCGHGVGAALAAASIRADLRALVAAHPLVAALSLLNERLVAEDSPRYACVGGVELTTTSVTIVNAGLPPVCVGRDGVVRVSVEASGIPPGMLPGGGYEASVVQVLPGDRILLMSDGVTEPFGPADATAAAAAELSIFDPRAWCEADLSGGAEILGRRMAKNPGPLTDDATVLVVEAAR